MLNGDEKEKGRGLLDYLGAPRASPFRVIKYALAERSVTCPLVSFSGCSLGDLDTHAQRQSSGFGLGLAGLEHGCTMETYQEGTPCGFGWFALGTWDCDKWERDATNTRPTFLVDN